jgi:alpha-beta hydrolase superfamily lysophospholipase
MSLVENSLGQEAWVARFFRRLSGLLIAIREEPYPRPEAGGTTMAYRLTPPGDLRGRIVFAHATGNDSLFPQVELFLTWLEAGFEIFAFDLDGHGARSTTILSSMSVETMITHAVERAASQHPALPLHGAGQSLGAALWLRSASQVQIPLQSLVLYSAPYTVNLSVRAGIRELLAPCTREFWEQRRYYGWTGVVPPLGPWRRRAYPIRLVTESRSADNKQHAIDSLNYPQHIAALIKSLAVDTLVSNISVPTLLLYGTQDKIVNFSQGQAVMERLSQGELIKLHGATHYTTPFHPEGLMASSRWFLQHRAIRSL